MDENQKQNLLNYIEQCHFFANLPKSILIDLLPQFEKIEINAGQTLFKQGEASEYLYVLISGELISLLTKPSGKTIIIGTIAPVQTIGELGALSGEPRSLSTEAVTDSALLKLPSVVFRKLCDEYPAILASISKIIIQRSLEIMELVAQEKSAYNVSIVLPLLKEKVQFKEQLQQHLHGAPIDFFICKENHAAEIKKAINVSETKNRHIIIFMEEWNEDIYKYCLEKINHFYVVLDSTETFHPTPFTNQLFNDFKRLPTVRLELVLLHPAHTKQPSNTKHWLKIANFSLHHHIRKTNNDDFQRLIRFMQGTAFTLVLGGGGARGLTHVGVIKAILNRKLSIDAIGGTSIGANVAAAYAHTLNYKKMVETVNTLKIAALESLSIKQLTWPIISLYSSNPATKALIDAFNNQRIEDLWIPYFAVSSNLTDKFENVHREGFLWEAGRSSAALPGIFPPIVSNGKLLFDGGLLNNLPVDTMRDLIGPSHTIMASSLAHRQKENEHYQFPPVLSRKEAIMWRLGLSKQKYSYPYFLETFVDALLLGSSAHEEKNCSAADLLVKPNLQGFKLLSIDVVKENELIQIGCEEANRAIDKFLASQFTRQPT